MKVKHFLRITDLTTGEIEELMRLAERLKKEIKTKGINRPLLQDKTLAMIFEKPSLRTRISFEIGMTQLGGHAIYLGSGDIQMGKRETVRDIGIVTSSMADLIMARTFSHKTIEELSEGSRVPVVNGLTDLEHPCQILADFLTIRERLGKMRNLSLAYLGDGENNVTHSLALLAVMLGNEFRCGAPKGYWMDRKVAREAKEIASKRGGKIVQTRDPVEAVKGADVVVTDTWVSMGDEKERKKRLKVLAPYQVTGKLMGLAKKRAIFMHCLPAYRGKEVASEVIDGPQSVVYQEAENRLHAQKALLVYLTH